MKTKDKIFWTLGAVLLMVLIVWGVCATAGSEFFNYEGYVIAVEKNESNQTVLTTVSGEHTHKFVLRWYTRQKFQKDEREISVGDRVMLTTTRFSDTNIEKISVNEGYSAEGKLVYTYEYPDKTFVLAVDPSSGAQYLIAVDGRISGTTGEKIRIYHAYPIYEQTVVQWAIARVSISEDSKLTEEEIAFVESKGYTLKE